MNEFKAGDRVIHQIHGIATVTGVEYDLGLVNIRPTGYPHYKTEQVHPISLTPVPAEPKFKIGDRVSHRWHPDGTVTDYSERSGLYAIDLPGNRGYFALEDQLRVPTTEPKFTVQVMFTDGDGINTPGPMFRQMAEAYLTQLPNWDNVESITITRAKG